MRWVLFCAVCLPVIGAQVRFQNFTGTNVVITNSERRLAVPPGEMAVNLEAGEWGSDQVPTVALSGVDETVVVRYSQDENGLGVVDLGVEQNALDITIRGFITGLSVFGFAWLVSVIVQGLRVGLGKVE